VAHNRIVDRDIMPADLRMRHSGLVEAPCIMLDMDQPRRRQPGRFSPDSAVLANIRIGSRRAGGLS
jgi:hypothetical protein